ncbi:hypothetical protein [Clostridium arbusti]|uniref:hypothetical protein n=1 Tax=Clostridium arbusti TaxID=1137848 RepID=UPI0002896957|nr:hypothetical protein [Clostridium arbusti]
MNIKITMDNSNTYIVKDKTLSSLSVYYHMALNGNKLLQLDNDIYVNPKHISEIKEITIDNNHDFVLNAD